jgi:hypothetical protein
MKSAEMKRQHIRAILIVAASARQTGCGEHHAHVTPGTEVFSGHTRLRGTGPACDELTGSGRWTAFVPSSSCVVGRNEYN